MYGVIDKFALYTFASDWMIVIVLGAVRSCSESEESEEDKVGYCY
jgi:hypothetical protein